jgi:hypothetical protein
MKTPPRLLLLLVAALVLAACGTPFSPDGAAYTYSAPSSGTVVVSASSLTDGNGREFFYSTTGTTYANSSACETVSGTSPAQPGIAFRITDKNNVTTAVTVTENVFGSSAYNDFNIHTWDTSESPAFSLVGQVRINAILSSPQPEPLNLCAEITGDVVQFVVWTSGTQPPWGDPTWGGSVTLPSNVPTSGYTGFFAGHIPARTSATYSNLTVDGGVNNPLSCCVSTQLARSRNTGSVIHLRRSTPPPGIRPRGSS